MSEPKRAETPPFQGLDRAASPEFHPVIAQAFERVEERLRHGAERMDTMQGELTSNTEVTTEIRDLLATARQGIRVIGAIGRAVFWVGAKLWWLIKLASKIAAVMIPIYGLLYAFFHGGKWPPTT